MPTAPPTLTDPPASPSRTSPSTFATLADAWVAWLETWGPDFEDASQAAYTNAGEAYSAAVSAQAAASGVTAALWVSGTTYAIGDVRRSTVNTHPYRRITAGAGTTDPSADATNWVLAAMFFPSMSVVSGTSATAVAWTHYVLTSASATTVTLPASPLAGDVVWITTANSRTDNVVARNGNDIMNIAQNMTLNQRNCTVQLRYVNGTIGWAIV